MTPRAHPPVGFVRAQDRLGGALGVDVEHEHVATLTEARLMRVRSAHWARPRSRAPPSIAVEELLGVHDATAEGRRATRSPQTPEPRRPVTPKHGTPTAAA